jgi:hypothetical protein
VIRRVKVVLPRDVSRNLDPALLEAEQRWNQLAAQRVRLRSRQEVAGFYGVVARKP